MLEIIGYLICVYLVFKGVEVFQIALVSSGQKRAIGLKIGWIAIAVSLVVAFSGIVLIHFQTSAISEVASVVESREPPPRKKDRVSTWSPVRELPTSKPATAMVSTQIWSQPGGADTGSTSLGYLQKNAQVKLFGIRHDSHGTWAEIETENGVKGWVDNRAIRE
jgi:hypothetical protein